VPRELVRAAPLGHHKVLIDSVTTMLDSIEGDLVGFQSDRFVDEEPPQYRALPSTQPRDRIGGKALGHGYRLGQSNIATV
jgi:hypothetical protein